MATLTTTQAYKVDRPITVGVKLNGGTLAVQTLVGSDWVETKQAIDGDYFVIDGLGSMVRFVPAAGAVYEINS
jgi:hypothetical protein